MRKKDIKVWEFFPDSPWEKGKEKVILIHGLFMYGFIMNPIAEYLAKKNYSPLFYDYPTIKYKVEEHGERLALFLEEYFREAEKNSYSGKLHFVTHSMGGLILRKALQLLPGNDREKVGNIVMIAPPNKGSDVAKTALKLLPFPAKKIRPLEGLSSVENSFANRENMPEEFGKRIGILGAENDLMVRKEYTFLSVAGERVFLPGQHTLILFRQDAKKAVYTFLKEGSFPPEMKRE